MSLRVWTAFQELLHDDKLSNPTPGVSLSRLPAIGWTRMFGREVPMALHKGSDMHAAAGHAIAETGAG
jgi:hypothetical protein